MVFVDRIAYLLGQSASKEALKLQEEFLSFFDILPSDLIRLRAEKFLVTQEEKEGILAAMEAEDGVDSYFRKSAKLRASNTDIEAMHKSYLYAVILAISGTKQGRFFDLIKEMSLDYFFDPTGESRENHGGWIPYRTPWITARILVNFSFVNTNEREDTAQIRQFVELALESLISRVNSDGIWKSGAGGWVSNWEATALSLEAILLNDHACRFVEKVKIAVSACLNARSFWLDVQPSIETAEGSNSTLGSVMLASVLLRLQERYFAELVIPVHVVNDLYSYLSEAMKVVSNTGEVKTLQYCTIPQIAAYCLEVVQR